MDFYRHFELRISGMRTAVSRAPTFRLIDNSVWSVYVSNFRILSIGFLFFRYKGSVNSFARNCQPHLLRATCRPEVEGNEGKRHNFRRLEDSFPSCYLSNFLLRPRTPRLKG